ncbi:MAG: UDP-N-acetylmuramate dehydrogenase [Candidatus Nealsonbacteria bacterium]
MMKFQENIPLKKYTTFKIGGPARYFFTAKNKSDLLKAVREAKNRHWRFFLLGGGSNLLVSDEGYKGLVIKTGKPLSSYISKGLEWAVGIPGTVEGAVYGNAGAFGKSMKDAVESVEVFNTATGKVEIFKNENCKFAYRESIFKRNKNLVILSVKIKQKRSNLKKIKEYLAYRKKNQPLDFPSAGSIFKNPENYSAGKLIEKAGLKGEKIGGAQISDIHSNFIVNLGDATAQDVLSLIRLIKETVNKKFKVKLEEEIIELKY